MQVHVVFVTNYRHRVFGDRHLRHIREIMRAVGADVEAALVEFHGESNHVHLLVNHSPKVAVSKLVNSLKGVSSRRLQQEFPDLVRRYRRAQRLWSGSSFAGSVGGAAEHRAPVLEQQNRPVQGTARPLAGLPARAFTTAVNGGALARFPVPPAGGPGSASSRRTRSPRGSCHRRCSPPGRGTARPCRRTAAAASSSCRR